MGAGYLCFKKNCSDFVEGVFSCLFVCMPSFPFQAQQACSVDVDLEGVCLHGA